MVPALPAVVSQAEHDYGTCVLSHVPQAEFNLISGTAGTVQAHNIKGSQFEILERGKTDKHCLTRESLLIKRLSSDLNKRPLGVKSLISIN